MLNISIIIPTYNSSGTISKCLDAIFASNLAGFNYEVLIIDDQSTDATVSLAKNYLCKIYINKSIKGSNFSRQIGFSNAKGQIIINIDSDVVVGKESIVEACNFLEQNLEYSACTALLSKKTFYKNFSSQYKNLYMHFYFKKLNSDVNFLYGSFYAVRKIDIKSIKLNIHHTNDTELGQQLINRHKKIKLLKNIEVVHQKYYDINKILKNDFLVPFEWAEIFWNHNGWKQLGKKGTGFAHASKSQLVSILLAPSIVLISSFNQNAAIIFLMLWFYLNANFLNFLKKEKGYVFFLKSVAFTFIDHLVMISGVFAGTLKILVQNLTKLL